MLHNLNVVEILRLGLGGFCFLLTLLSFWLIRREQDLPADSHKGTLKVIYIFIAANIVSIVLVGGWEYLDNAQASAAELLGAKTYLIEDTSFLLDFAQWKPKQTGAAIVLRSDFITKVSDTTDDFVIPSYTTGQGIEWHSRSGESPSFTEKNDPDQPGKHYYEYRLPVGRQPKNHTERAVSEFIFPDGFRNPKQEWFKAYVPYPTKALSVVIRFPPDRPCRKADVSLQPGHKSEQQIKDNLPLLSDGGQLLTWTGADLPAETRIKCTWNW